MNKTLWFIFYFRLPNGRGEEKEVVGETFERCLKKAQHYATHKKAEITAWIEL